MYTALVFSTGGLVYWKRSPLKNEVPLSVFNDAISSSFEGKSAQNQFTVKVARNHELNIAAAVAHPSIVTLRDAGAVAQDLVKIFSTVCGPDLPYPNLDKFENLADLRLSEGLIASLESRNVPEIPDPDIASVVESEAAALDATTPRQQSPNVTPRSTTPSKKEKKKKSKKKARKWGEFSDDEDDSVVLDYSEPPNAQDLGEVEANAQDLGVRTNRGFEVKQLSDELGSILRQQPEAKSDRSGALSFLKGYVGGKKLTDEDLDKTLEKMEDHLVAKNVAKEIAQDICQQVRHDLLGATTSSWTSINATAKSSMSRILSRILTPNSSADLLLEIQKARAQKRVYVMSIVGVNGVGKSTNLGKIAFWLLQNNFKVLIAACDTFRSGAVEQLKVHVQRLQKLSERQDAGKVELFDQGYGKDAAVIAKKAVEYGQKHSFDVVLIDTAGRRHNDERLMSSLEKFGKFANPDKIIMVGEALVGTDSVQQARNFNNAFGPERNIDFFLISKCDTVGDMLGTLVNMTSSTGIPVLFVGVGQNYTDLRTLSVEWAVNLLLS